MLPPWRWIHFCNSCGLKFKDRYGLIGKAPPGVQFQFVFQDAVLGDVPDMRQLRGLVRETALGHTSDPTWQQGILRSDASFSALEFAPTEERPAWVCRLDGALRGFSISDLGRREISALCVDPDFERNGIGRNLHNSAVDLLFSKGLESISIIAAPYTRAQKFLHAAGWRLTDAEPDGDYRLELRADVWRVRRRRF